MFILEDLWWGDLHPCEKSCRRSAAFTEKAAKVTVRETAFRRKLSAEDAETYDQVLSLYNELSAYEACDAFIHGFRLGSQVILDVVGSYDSSPFYEIGKSTPK